jgi:RND superfamily putative drug exporter
MASLLERLGRAAFRRRRLVLAGWLAVLAATFAAAATLSGPTSSSFSIPGTESQRAIDLLEQRLPEANGGAGRIVFAAPQGRRLDGARRAAVTRAVADVRAVRGVRAVEDPFGDDGGLVSPDGRVALAPVTFDRPADDVADAERRAVQDAAGRARVAGVQVELGGDAVVESADEGAGEALGLPIAALVLTLTFGSLVAAGLSLLTAGVGVGIGMAGIAAATGLVDLDDSVPTVALMLGLAVGIDYAVFILSRHRGHLHAGMAPEEAAGRAIGTAGGAVVFAGGTVVIALAGLSVVGVPFLTAMGLAAAGTVALAVAVALTLVPALLGFAGTRLARGRRLDVPADGGRAGARRTMGARWVGLVTRHRVAALVATVVALGACSLPVLDLRLGLPDDSSAAPRDTNRKAYDLLSEGFGAGFNGPLTVVVDRPGGGVERSAEAVASALRGLDDVARIGAPAVNRAGDTAILTLTPDSGPSSKATKKLVDRVRDRAGVLERRTGARILVTGQTAVNIDVVDRLGKALLPFLAVVIGLALVLLTIAFRSILVPLTAIGGFLLTIGATFGALVAIFQKGVAADLIGVAQTAPIISLLPIIIIAILFGLAMDYQVFLVSRMREEHVNGAPPTRAITDGFRHGARIVTAAALIMGAVFSGFILGQDPVIKSVGFSLAFGILVDAFVVRMTLIPAVMSLLGDHAWWRPGPRDRARRRRRSRRAGRTTA